ncbi:MAG: hypothetical protein R6U84_03445 [Candidatus Cloacimonadales bacterium]
MKKGFESLIDINQRKGFPRTYRFNQFIRWFTLLLGVFAIAYALWVIFNKIDGDSSRIIKFAPILILLLAVNSVIRNLFTLNSMKFYQDRISFRYIGKLPVDVKWSDFVSMKLSAGKRKAVQLIYHDEGKERDFRFFLSFPHILEVINSIAEMAPQMELDDFMQSIVVSEKERKKLKKAKISLKKADSESKE